MLSGFENIFPYDSENVLIGSEIGFYNINFKKYREKKLPYLTYITSVKIIGNGDSTIYGGFNRKVSSKITKVSIPYKYNSIHFSYASSFLGINPKQNLVII